MKKSRFSEAQIVGILKEVDHDDKCGQKNMYSRQSSAPCSFMSGQSDAMNASIALVVASGASTELM